MNILGTLFDILGKSKDGLSAKRDLVHLKIRLELVEIKESSFLPLVTLLQRKKNVVF